MSPKAVEILKNIKETWNELQNAPNGTLLPNGVSLPPSSGTYLHNVDNLEKQVGSLSDETSNGFQTELRYLCHTVDKECAYVKHYRYDARKSKEKNHEALSGLMREANEQIALDLLPILQLTHNI